MSYMKQDILTKIKNTLDQIESNVCAFQSLNSETRNIEQTESTFSIKSLHQQTKNIMHWCLANGACADITHCNGNIISKWDVLVDDLHWALFGSGIKDSTVERNKLNVIHFKLVYILHTLKPSLECY